MAEKVARDGEGRITSSNVSAEAEQAVLGVLLVGDQEAERAWLQMRDDFAPRLFASAPAMQTVAGVMESMLRAGRAVDPVLLLAELDRLHVPEDVVPRALPWMLARAIGSAANVGHYMAELLRKKAERDGDAARRRPPPPRIGDRLSALVERLERRQQGKERPVPLPDGWEALRKLLGGGLWPGMYMLIGNTASGKSQYALQVLHHAASVKVPGAYIGLELDELGVGARLLTMAQHARDPHTRTMWSYLYNGQLDRAAFGAVCSSASDLEKLPLHVLVEQAYGFGAERMMEVMESMRAAYPEERDADGRGLPGSRPFLVVLDFLQLTGGESATGRMLELRERIAQASYAARQAARKLNAVVLLVSSTARENYAMLDNDESRANGKDGKGATRVPFGEGDPARFIGLGKESGEIEYAADFALVLGRLAGQSGPPPWKMACGVAKVRARSREAVGLDGWARMGFDGTFWGEVLAGDGAPVSWREPGGGE